MTQLSVEAVCMIELFHLGFVFNFKIDSTIELSKFAIFLKLKNLLFFNNHYFSILFSKPHHLEYLLNLKKKEKKVKNCP